MTLPSSIALVLVVGLLALQACGNRSSTTQQDGFLDGTGHPRPDAGVCGDKSRVVLGGEEQTLRDVRAAIVLHFGMPPGGPTVFVFDLTLQDPDPTLERRLEIALAYSTPFYYSGSVGPLDQVGRTGSVVLSKCASPDCSAAIELDRVYASDMMLSGEVTLWPGPQLGNRLVSLCAHLVADDPSAHPSLADLFIFVEPMRAEWSSVGP